MLRLFCGWFTGSAVLTVIGLILFIVPQKKAQ